MSSATAGGTDVRGQGPRRAGQSRSGRASRRVAGREGQERLPRACGGDPDWMTWYARTVPSSPRTRGYYQIPRRQQENTVPFRAHYDPLSLLFTPNGQESAKPQVSKTRGLSSQELRRVMSSHRSGGLRRRALCAAFPCPASASGEGPFQLRRERDAE